MSDGWSPPRASSEKGPPEAHGDAAEARGLHGQVPNRGPGQVSAGALWTKGLSEKVKKRKSPPAGAKSPQPTAAGRACSYADNQVKRPEYPDALEPAWGSTKASL